MPLTELVEFRAIFQRGNRIQVPRSIRWQFKLEPSQLLKITVSPAHYFGGGETFYSNMNKDGRITLPHLTRALLKSSRDPNATLDGTVLQVRLQPALPPKHTQ